MSAEYWAYARVGGLEAYFLKGPDVVLSFTSRHERGADTVNIFLAPADGRAAAVIDAALAYLTAELAKGTSFTYYDVGSSQVRFCRGGGGHTVIATSLLGVVLTTDRALLRVVSALRADFLKGPGRAK